MAGVLRTLLELAPSIIQAGTSIFQTERTNNEATRQYNQNLAFNTETRNTNWQREDNQIQRAVADAHAAGFSPLAALGNTATGATASAPSSNVQGGQQADLSGLVNSIGQLVQNAWQSKENEKQREHENQMNLDKLEAEKEMASANITSTENIAKDNRNEQARQFDEKLKSDSTYQDKLLKFQAIAQTEEQEYKYAMMYQEWYKENHIPGAPMGEECKTWKEYNTAMTSWYAKAKKILTELGVDEELIQKTTDGGKVSANLLGILKSDLGANSENQGTQSNAEMKQRQWEAWLKSHPQPVPPSPSSYNNRHKEFEK